MRRMANGPVLVISTVTTQRSTAKELELHAPLTTVGYCSGRTGSSTSCSCFVSSGAAFGAGEIPAHHPEFEIDHERCERFLITHHPKATADQMIALLTMLELRSGKGAAVVGAEVELMQALDRTRGRFGVARRRRV